MNFDFLGLRKSLDAFAGNVRTVRERLETLRREREELAVAPCSREDAIAIIHKRIDEAGGSFLKNFTLGTLTPVIMKAHKGAVGSFNHSILAAPVIGQAPEVRHLEAGIFFAFNKEVKAAVDKAVRMATWPENAIPLAQRESRLQKLDDEIASMERDEAELVKQANEAGVILS